MWWCLSSCRVSIQSGLSGPGVRVGILTHGLCGRMDAGIYHIWSLFCIADFMPLGIHGDSSKKAV